MLLVLALAVHTLAPGQASADPCADAVRTFTPGTNGGFQADLLPNIVLGVPFGGGLSSGSTDVVSLGDGGTIILGFEDNVIVDRPGPDFTVFENVFVVPNVGPFTEVGTISVSDDGVHFVTFSHDATTFAGFAGVTPGFSNPDNGIDPRDPTVSGGDSFDLAAVGLTEARFVRITDPGASVPDAGNAFPTPGVGKSGFDLDAIVAVHSVDTCAQCCDADGNGSLAPNDVLLLLREVSELPNSINLCGQAPCRGLYCGDANRDRVLTAGDVLLCLRAVSGLPTPIALCATGDCDFPR
ncbi:MAG: hypothetical protein HY271_08425 [Deltaproteobacteria bacterium]|nr:hypothetical protein [Deltaproteobacteria bacterium]